MEINASFIVVSLVFLMIFLILYLDADTKLCEKAKVTEADGTVIERVKANPLLTNLLFAYTFLGTMTLIFT